MSFDFIGFIGFYDFKSFFVFDFIDRLRYGFLLFFKAVFYF